MARSSVASSTGTADRLDFTGVYRGSANSLESSRSNGIVAVPHQIEGKPEKSKQDPQDEFKNKSPTGFAGTASGFLWKAGSGFNGLKRSGADTQFGTKDSRVSFAQRPTLADRVHTLSASLASTLRRFLHGKGNQEHNGNVTSPQSQCSAPAALPRDYDHNGFYEAPFKVPGLNKPLEPHLKATKMTLGAILVRVVVYGSNVFNLSADDAIYFCEYGKRYPFLCLFVMWSPH
ncbi:hypothetical protein BBJ29_009313 [Phytophthora kernoviae]|uniref:Uncharacterized protein n=1 Tax=Phytophthora kernoviae TaxID=325452 RepID=A0A3R7IZR5_9STRA|nr:hypothetical protein BBJ29_009313 [Phytophthora kernoviae]